MIADVPQSPDREQREEGGHWYSTPVGYARRTENSAHHTPRLYPPDIAQRTHISEKWQAKFSCAK